MKKYLVFAGDKHYPFGGMEDYKGDCDSMEEARKLIKEIIEENSLFKGGAEWWQIVDYKSMEVVCNDDEDDNELS